MSGSPGLHPLFGNAVSFRQVVKLLEHVSDIQAFFEAVPHLLTEFLLKIPPDHKNDAGKSCANGVIDRIIQQSFTGRSDRIHLFQSAVTAAHARG